MLVHFEFACGHAGVYTDTPAGYETLPAGLERVGTRKTQSRTINHELRAAQGRLCSMCRVQAGAHQSHRDCPPVGQREVIFAHGRYVCATCGDG